MKPLAGLVGLYLAIYIFFGRLSFPPQGDETHFWQSSLFFSHSLFPTVEQLRSYTELNTPLPFVVFGMIEFLFHQGIWAGRVCNLLLSFLTTRLILFAGGAVNRLSLLATCGCFLCPYYVGVGVHLYTDIMAIFFTLWGVKSFLDRKLAVSAVAFVLAISCRQYAVAFPLGLLLFYIVDNWRSIQKPSFGVAASLAIAVLSLPGWYWFFGGRFAPAPAFQVQQVDTAQPSLVLPANAGYFLACLGLYYVIPEFVLISRSFSAKVFFEKRALFLVALLLLLFVLFPPVGNGGGYQIASMGLLDKVLRACLGDFPRVSVFFLLAALAVVRFRSWSLESVLILTNAIMLMKAHLIWDKYALPVLVVLWFQLARSKETGWHKESVLSGTRLLMRA